MSPCRETSPAAPPSPWVVRFAGLIAPKGDVLDVACGAGRHARWLAQKGFHVLAVDREPTALALLSGLPHVTPVVADLEMGAWPFTRQCFDAVVVTHYLYRPRFNELLSALVPGGVLIYETFMVGQERYGRPSNPDFLLQHNELIDRLSTGFSIVAFEQGIQGTPGPVALQRVCAIKGLVTTPLPPGIGGSFDGG